MILDSCFRIVNFARALIQKIFGKWIYFVYPTMSLNRRFSKSRKMTGLVGGKNMFALCLSTNYNNSAILKYRALWARYFGCVKCNFCLRLFYIVGLFVLRACRSLAALSYRTRLNVAVGLFGVAAGALFSSGLLRVSHCNSFLL